MSHHRMVLAPVVAFMLAAAGGGAVDIATGAGARGVRHDSELALEAGNRLSRLRRLFVSAACRI